MQRFDAWEMNSHKNIERLEHVYQDKLVLEWPSKLWEKIGAQQTKAWRIWLGVFAAMVVIPLGLIWWRWDSFSLAIMTVTGTHNGSAGLSIGGVAAITVPALFYAWLLKSVSRLFIHSLNTATDAQHRRAMALTYLALARNKRLDMKEAERALILNALFRPVGVQGMDEGPPMGLLDLLKSKS